MGQVHPEIYLFTKFTQTRMHYFKAKQSDN